MELGAKVRELFRKFSEVGAKTWKLKPKELGNYLIEVLGTRNKNY